ncbi:hypothetical protein [Rhodococcus jostii]|uniref:hypothetical protein n=1 Tax=Rhodococcus jostii TaxID=132919 RepID=UPI00363252CD
MPSDAPEGVHGTVLFENTGVAPEGKGAGPGSYDVPPPADSPTGTHGTVLAEDDGQVPPHDVPDGMLQQSVTVDKCSILWLDTGSSGFRATGGTYATCVVHNINGHVQMWGPGFSINGPEGVNPTAIYNGWGRGTVCARLWRQDGMGGYLDMGTACHGV